MWLIVFLAGLLYCQSEISFPSPKNILKPLFIATCLADSTLCARQIAMNSGFRMFAWKTHFTLTVHTALYLHCRASQPPDRARCQGTREGLQFDKTKH